MPKIRDQKKPNMMHCSLFDHFVNEMCTIYILNFKLNLNKNGKK